MPVKYSNYKLFIITSIFFYSGLSIFSQKSDLDIPDTTSIIYIRKNVNNELNKTLRLSIIPGLSQIKNKKYWEIPFYYGGLSVLTISAINNHKKIKEYNSLYIDSYNDFLPYSYFTVIDDATIFEELIKKRNNYKTNRNLCIGGIGLLYAINFIDGIKPVYKNYHSAYKAGLYSAFLPGLGQIYNKEFWKVPLVYIGFSTFAYFINFNHVEYKKALNAYLNKQDPEALKYAEEYISENEKYYYKRTFWDKQNLTKGVVYNYETYYQTVYSEDDILLNKKKQYKRWRDLNIIGISAFYAINIIDATVFAHLVDYDVSDVLTFNIFPKISTFTPDYLNYSILLTLNF